MMQNKVIRIIYHANIFDYACELFHHIQIFNVVDLIELKTCVIMYEAFHHLLHSSQRNRFCKFFVKRHCYNFYVIYVNTRMEQFSI